jgi:predicted nucleotidyltransferase
MTNILLSLSGRLDPSLVKMLRVVDQAATTLSIRFFVVGAMARAIVLEHCYGIRPGRTTRDLDIGVEVANWEEFQQLSTKLVATGEFAETSKPHELRTDFCQLHIVPFGGISSDQRTIRWPPEHEVVMTIVGFEEAYESAMLIRLSDKPLLEVKMPTIPGMALMKLISWNDRFPERPKDAEDLFFLMDHYAEAGNDERLYREEAELLQAESFDPVIAGIRLLGSDMATIANDSTRKTVVNILEDETKNHSKYRLVRDMTKGARLYDAFNETLEKLKKLEQGFRERVHRKVGE